MPLSVRLATPRDVPQILQFIQGLAEYEKLSHECTATEAQLHQTLFGQRPAAECMLAFMDAEPAGFAIYFTNYSTFLAKPGLYLEDLFVLPRFRKQGVGKGLILHLAALANQRGYGRMEWTVLDWNQPAIDFYVALGAEIKSEWRVCRLSGASLQKFASPS